LCYWERRTDFPSSNSQFRKQNFYFWNEEETSVDSILDFMGDFSDIRPISKFLSRRAQCFTATYPTILLTTENEDLKDHSLHDNFNFSDGVGTISFCLAENIERELSKFIKCKSVKAGQQVQKPSSAYQIRYGGCKGVVSVDMRLPYKNIICIRPSMDKFRCSLKLLEVVSYSKYRKGYLNRQIIQLLSALQIPDHVFLELQSQHTSVLLDPFKDPTNAHNILKRISGFPQDSTDNNYNYTHDPFCRQVLYFKYLEEINKIVHNAKIYVDKSANILGIVDETVNLKYGQVFLHTSKHGVIKGPVIVAKNPCLHPGDVRVLEAVDVPILRRMKVCDVVVFPSLGKRPHPNECSGSDLDGDRFFVSWEPSLIPIPIEPLNYECFQPPPGNSDRAYDENDVLEFIQKFTAGREKMGKIANKHTILCDKLPLGASNPICKGLAEQFAIAVDFPKTGINGMLTEEALYALQQPPVGYPDFMEKNPQYPSTSIIGQLYHNSKFLQPSSFLQFSRSPLVALDIDDQYANQTTKIYLEYCTQVLGLMQRYEISSDAEVVSGSILGKQDEKEIREGAKWEYSEIRMTYRRVFQELCKENDKELMELSWYKISNTVSAPHHSSPLRSFGWINGNLLWKALKRTLSKGPRTISLGVFESVTQH